MQHDVLAVVPDTAEPDQIRAVDGRRENARGRVVGSCVVDQDDVEADDAVDAGAR